jgi:hypothetical protein
MKALQIFLLPKQTSQSTTKQGVHLQGFATLKWMMRHFNKEFVLWELGLHAYNIVGYSYIVCVGIDDR